MNERKIKLKTGEIWQERLVAGNGHSGVICSCDPYEEVLTYQNIELLMPTEEPRMTPPEVGSELQEARQAVLHMDATWNVHGRKRTYLYATIRGCSFGSRHHSRSSKHTAAGW